MKISLEKWIQQACNPPVSIVTARRWIAFGKISPPPVKMGRAWFVQHDAEYVGSPRRNKKA